MQIVGVLSGKSVQPVSQGGFVSPSRSWELAATVVSALCSGYSRQVVLCPGSRNSGLAIALAEAEQQQLLDLFVRVDERVAGFTALGLAKASNNPACVVTTSGSAVGNLLPAVMEAWHSHLPLVLITADRPQRLQGTGSNQTTNQAGIFGTYVVDLIQILADSGSKSEWERALARAFASATGARTNRPGPVQINLALDTPLLPEPGASLTIGQGEVFNEIVVEPLPPASKHLLSAGKKTVVVAGDGRPSEGLAANELARQAGWPLFAEPSSNARFGSVNAIANYRLLLPKLGQSIERVVMFGHPTLSRPITELLSNPQVELIVDTPYADWNDPGSNADLVTKGTCIDTAIWQLDQDWLDLWKTADQMASEQVVRITAGFTGPMIAKAVVGAIKPGDYLVFGSSNCIRDADLAPVRARSDVTTFANRGLSGIDGNISTALGIAQYGTTTLLLGDLAYFHDVGALAATVGEQRPNLRVVVLDDHGGSIFSTLEQGATEYESYFERAFAAAQQADPKEIAEGFGVKATSVNSLDELAENLAKPIKGLEVVVCQVRRDNRREMDLRLKDIEIDSSQMSG